MSGRARRKRLGTLESQVMKQVWSRGRATTREVLDAMPGRRRHAYTTIATTLRNLERKGLLRHVVEGRTHVYIPRVDKAAMARSSVRDLLDRFFDGSRLRLVAALFDDEELSPDEFEALRRRIIELRDNEEGSDA